MSDVLVLTGSPRKNGNTRILADAFEREENENGILLEGIISRKKQLIPTLMNAMAEKV